MHRMNAHESPSQSTRAHRVLAVFFFVAAFVGGMSPVLSQKAYAVLPTTDYVDLPFDVKATVDQSVQTTTSVKTWLQDALKQVARGLAMQTLRKFTVETVNWINQGNDGKPLYVTNTGEFFDSIADEQVKVFTNKIGYDPVKYPYAKDFLQYYITNYTRQKLDPLATNSYTLPNSCATNFSWSCWNATANNTANNPFGAFFEASRKLDQSITDAVSKADKEVSSAGGFLAMKTCEVFQPAPAVVPETYTDTSLGSINSSGGLSNSNPGGFEIDDTGMVVIDSNTASGGVTGGSEGSGGSANAGGSNQINTGPVNGPTIAGSGSTQTNSSAASPCLKYRTSTPGTVVGDRITTALSSGTRQNELAAALGSSVSAIFDALYNRFVGEGLNSLSTELFSSITGQQEQNMWNYYGQSLGTIQSSNTTIALSDWASGPDVIVDLNQALGVPYAPGGKVPNPSSISLTNDEAAVYKSITETVKSYPAALQKLDECLPGPDFGWEARFNEALNEEASKIDKKIGASDNDNADAALDELRGIRQRVDLAIIRMRGRMLTANIPSAVEIYDTIMVESQKASQFKSNYEKYLDKLTTQRRLENLRESFISNETDLATILGQYQALLPKVSTNESLLAAQAEKAEYDLGLERIADMKAICESESQEMAAAHPLPTTNSLYDGFHGVLYEIEEDNPYFVEGTPNYPAHYYYYCKSIINDCPDASDGAGDNDDITVVPPDSSCITLDNVFKERNFELSCFDFYESDPSDYFLGAN